MRAFFASITRHIVDARSGNWLLAACCLWLAATAGLRPLMLPDEGRYVGIAWEMLTQGNWLVPTLDGMPFFHKPPLFYWLTRLGLEIFGPNAWAGRLASTSSAILAVVALYAFVRKHRDTPTANLAAVILVTQPFFFGGAQFANLDMLVAAMITLTIVAVADAAIAIERNEPYRRSLTAGYVFAALGVLAKGLIGIMLPGAIVVAWLVLRRKFAVLYRLLNLPLIALFLAVAAPWFWQMQRQYPGFWDYFFIYHHFQRFTETGFNNQQAFWFYVPVLLLCTLPWSPWGARLLARSTWKAADPGGFRSLMLLWTLGIIIFFSIPKSKLVGYILPALPPFACLLAEAVKRWWDGSRKENSGAWLGVNVVGAWALCLTLIIVVARHNPSELDHFASKTSREFSGDGQIVMLDEYQYDLPFYLKATRTPWVVSNWQDPAIPKFDNWRKELFDAGKFAPEIQRANLITQQELSARLCSTPDITYWVWASKDAAQRLPALASAEMMFANTKKSMWRLESGRLKQSKFCD